MGDTKQVVRGVFPVGQSQASADRTTLMGLFGLNGWADPDMHICMKGCDVSCGGTVMSAELYFPHSGLTLPGGDLLSFKARLNFAGVSWTRRTSFVMGGHRRPRQLPRSMRHAGAPRHSPSICTQCDGRYDAHHNHQEGLSPSYNYAEAAGVCESRQPSIAFAGA